MRAVLFGGRGSQANEDSHDAAGSCSGIGLAVVHPPAKSIGVQAKGWHRGHRAGVA